MKKRPIYSLRLAETERRVLAAAATRRQVPLSTYLREMALKAATEDLVAAIADGVAAVTDEEEEGVES